MAQNRIKEIYKNLSSDHARWTWLALLAIILLTSAIRIRLLAVPLERDEGEYAYTGQLILQGIPPYEKAYNMKMPGIYVAYALILAIFGQSHTDIHLGLLFINAATVILVFLLAKNLFDPLVGLFAGAAYALLSAGQPVQGFSANAEHFVILPVIAAILLLLRNSNARKYFLIFAGGLLLGLAFMMKQHAAVFIVFTALYLLANDAYHRPFNWKLFMARGVLFATGVFLPFILTCMVLSWCGVLERFWFWTFDYAKHYASLVPLEFAPFGLKLAASSIVPPASGLWTLAGTGLFCLFWNSRFRKKSLFVTAFLIFSFLSLCPGLYFRPHYFILFLPAVSLLAGIGTASICEIFSRYNSFFFAKVTPLILTLVILFFTLYQQWNYFFKSTPIDISRGSYGANPFPESLEIAHFIKKNSQKADTIAVLGSEPQIYFYSDRCSATGYIYTFALMEHQPYALKMQKEMIDEIESAAPRFIIFVNSYLSWLPAPDSHNDIFEWFAQYQKKYYNRVGLVDIFHDKPTVYLWGEEAIKYEPADEYWIAVFERKN